MKKLNLKNIIILILMLVALIGIISDFITLMSGATYTWFGVATALINIIILGKGCDYFEGI